MGCDKNLSELCRTWKLSQMWCDKKSIRTLSDLKIVTNVASQKTNPKFFGLENCHKWGVTKNLSEIFRTWKLSQQQAAVPRDEADPLHSGKNLSDPTLEPNRLKNVTKFVPQKQSDPTLEPNGLANCHKWVVTKAYPNSVGLENCHKWGVTKNLSELCRTWKLSQMWHHKEPIRNISDLKIVTKAIQSYFMSWIAIRSHFGT